MSNPTTIRVSKGYAAWFFVICLALSYAGFAEVLEENNMSMVKKAVIIVASLFGLFIAIFGLYSLMSKRFEYKPNAPVYSDKEPFVTITETELICDYPSMKKQEKIVWDKVNLIQILTTDEGPAVCDVFIVINDTDGGGVVVPQDKEESKQVLDKILKFPGFDSETFIQAMGSAENKWFTVWKIDSVIR